MKIQKKYQGAIPLNRIANEYNESEVNTYSTEYINNLIVNNLTTNDPHQALSAAQGKMLNDKIQTIYYGTEVPTDDVGKDGDVFMVMTSTEV